MEIEPGTAPDRVDPFIQKAATVGFGIVVTAFLLSSIVGHWRNYDVMQWMIAVSLLANLAVLPLAAIRNQRAGKKDDPYSSLQTTYLLLLLVILLFKQF